MNTDARFLSPSLSPSLSLCLSLVLVCMWVGVWVRKETETVYVGMSVEVYVQILFFSFFFPLKIITWNLHSMLQFILRTSPRYCVVFHVCIVPCCPCCLTVVMCHKKNHTWTYACTRAHAHTHTCIHTHTLSISHTHTHTYINTRQHTVYIFRYVHTCKISQHLHRANFRWLIWFYPGILFIGTHSCHTNVYLRKDNEIVNAWGMFTEHDECIFLE